MLRQVIKEETKRGGLKAKACGAQSQTQALRKCLRLVGLGGASLAHPRGAVRSERVPVVCQDSTPPSYRPEGFESV